MKKISFTLILLIISLHSFSQTWQSIATVGGPCNDMLPVASHRMLAGSWNDEIDYTDDLGNSWQTALSDVSVRKFAKLSSTLYAATIQGLYKSTDNGTDWTLVLAETFDDAATYNNQLWLLEDNTGEILKTSDGISFDSIPSPDDLSIDLQISSNGVIVVAGGNYPYVSTDGGSTFTKMTLPSGSYAPKFDASNILYAPINADSLYSSADNGQTWNKITTGFNMDASYKYMYEDMDGNILYGCNGDDTGGLFITPNKGATWYNITSNVCDGFIPYPYDISQNDQGYYFVNCGYGGMYRSNSTSLPLGIAQVAAVTNSLNVYPNPAGSYCILKTSKLSGNSQVMVYNMQGELVLSKNTESKNGFIPLDIQNLASDVYMVELVSGGNSSYTKLIKS